MPLRPEDLQALLDALTKSGGGKLQVSLYRNAILDYSQAFV